MTCSFLFGFFGPQACSCPTKLHPLWQRKQLYNANKNLPSCDGLKGFLFKETSLFGLSTFLCIVSLTEAV